MNTRTPTSSAAPSPGPDRAGVHAHQLVKRFGDDDVIKSLDLAVEPGTIVGLIGPSGCGKTTTVRLLTGLLTPTSGEASINGTPSTHLSGKERSRIGYLPQLPALFPDLSLSENLSFHASMYGLPFRRRRRVDELLDWVELSGDRSKRVADASGGMQRRLALAAAFVHDPDIVFLDEPTAGIDPILREKFWERFRVVAEEGKTLLVTTQYVGEAGECDMVGLLSDGELLLLDTPTNLRRAAFAGEVVDVTLDRPATDAEIERIRAHRFVIGDVERPGPKRIRIVVEDADAAMEDIAGALRELSLEAVELSEHVVDYDEAFVRVVERHRDGTPAGDGDASTVRAADGPTDGGPTDGGPTDDGPTDDGEVAHAGAAR
jgi:ABC-2 type transport system ATP-binding protein